MSTEPAPLPTPPGILPKLALFWRLIMTGLSGAQQVFVKKFLGFTITITITVSATAGILFAVGMNQAGAPIPGTGSTIAASPGAEVVALEYCQKPETQVTLVRTPQQTYYEAKWEEPGLRYDFTWQIEGTAIAVERTIGRETDIWAEQIDEAFLECVKVKPVKVREATH